MGTIVTQESEAANHVEFSSMIWKDLQQQYLKPQTLHSNVSKASATPPKDPRGHRARTMITSTMSRSDHAPALEVVLRPGGEQSSAGLTRRDSDELPATSDDSN